MCTDPNLLPLVSPRSVLQSGQNMKIVVPSAGIWGTASVEGANLDRHNAGKEQAASHNMEMHYQRSYYQASTLLCP